MEFCRYLTIKSDILLQYVKKTALSPVKQSQKNHNVLKQISSFISSK